MNIFFGILVFGGIFWWVYRRTDMILAPPPFAVDNSAENFGLNAQEIEFEALDGARLSGWWIAARGAVSDRTVICVHGWGTNSSDILPSTWYLAEEGFNVMYFDFRGCGQSPRHGLCSLGFYERHDLEAAIHWVKNHQSRYSRFLGIYGLSMGGVAALAIGAGKCAKLINAMTIESSFAGFYDVVASYVKLTYFLPAFPFADVFVGLLRWRTGWVNHESVSPRESLKRFSVPRLFMIYGSQDRLVPDVVFRELEELARRLRGVRVETWICPGAGHAECFDQEPRVYREKLVSFFKSAVSTVVN